MKAPRKVMKLPNNLINRLFVAWTYVPVEQLPERDKPAAQSGAQNKADPY
jgi:hypothetical protein